MLLLEFGLLHVTASMRFMYSCSQYGSPWNWIRADGKRACGTFFAVSLLDNWHVFYLISAHVWYKLTGRVYVFRVVILLQILSQNCRV